MLFLHTLFAVFAASNTMSLADGFAPSPMTAEINQANDNVSGWDKGHKTCGMNQVTTSKVPSLRFHLAQPMTDLRLSFDTHAFPVVERDDGSYYCVKNNTLWPKKWPAGEFRVYIYSIRTLKAKVTFEQPKRLQALVPAALAKTPIITQGKTVQNPQPGRYTPTALFERSTSGISCAPGTLSPLARLDVTQESNWKVLYSDSIMFFDVTRNACRTVREQMKLLPGRYQIWAKNHASGEAVGVTLQDMSASMRFGKAPTSQHRRTGANSCLGNNL